MNDDDDQPDEKYNEFVAGCLCVVLGGLFGWVCIIGLTGGFGG
jgi:hypothetical protein